ncbi:hypothetical protein [Luteimonas sp. MC1750]|uniref:hypothetical protein n=1 Tax=Luteimonas sp. MC1750 TaxID=2799326 RepID=UPI0018F0B30B|nr:hypothetical protein [Luteimonas sp. MC1750]MBJ6984214.1 hypothetical protein [Luteimonas sp. MC1750]QQO06999.1 hypothetical protein JGR68_06170 [Luteimonas sp. MC1750]
MAELTKNQKGLVALMAVNDQNAAQGFNLLATYERPEDFLDELVHAGMFSPEKNPSPRPADAAGGGLFLPSWPAMDYLTRVGKVASARSDVSLGTQLVGIVRAISAYRDGNGDRIDNYYTSAASAEIFGLVPPQCVTLADIEFVADWLGGDWNNGMVVKELDDGLFTSHLRQPAEQSRTKLVRLLEIVTSLRPDVEGSDLSGKAKSVADPYWLEQLLKHHASEIGRIVKEPGVSCLMTRTEEAFGVGDKAERSWMRRPAVEEHEQNHDWDHVRNALVVAARDSLQAWLAAEPGAASGYVARALASPHQIVRRIGIHTCRLNWALLSGVFFGQMNQDTFRPGHLHELYLLLKQHFADMDDPERRKVLDAIAALTVGEQGADLEQARYRQRNWLHAIQGRGNNEADVAFARVSDGMDHEIRDYPDFLSYHQMSIGAGPSPVEDAEIIAAASEGRLVQLVDEYEPPFHPLASPRKALLDSVANAATRSPGDFLRYLDWAQPMSRRLQYALLAGLGEAVKRAEGSERHIDADALADTLLAAYGTLLSDPAFWSEVVDENDDFEPDRDWIPPIVVEFVTWLCSKDDLRFDETREAQCVDVVRSALEQTEGLNDADDALTAAINSPRGKALEALFAVLLRVCRDADRCQDGHAERWEEFRPLLEAELQHVGTGHLEVYALMASRIQQLLYVDADWVTRNISSMFPEGGSRFRAAVIGLGYASSSAAIYTTLMAADVPARVLLSNEIDGAARDRMIERVALAYIWGQEPIDGGLIGRLFDEAHFDDVREMARAVGRWTDQRLSEDQRVRALAFGARCAAFANDAPAERKSLLAEVAQYLAFRLPPNAEDLGWLLTATPFVTEHHGLYEFMESAAQVAETEPKTALKLMQALAKGRPLHYDHEGRIERTLRLIAADGLRVEVVRVIDQMSENGVLPGLLALYEELAR